MKAFIVTKGNKRFRVLDVVEKYGWDATFVCDNKQQASRLQRMGVSHVNIKVTGFSDSGIQGVSMARDYVAKYLMPRDEWCIWIDDNVYEITCLPLKLSKDRIKFGSHSERYRTAFNHVASCAELRWHIKQTIAKADDAGTIFCGFATETNYFFRRLKWQRFGQCRTQFALYKNDGSSWFPFDTMMIEDTYKTVDVVARYGSIVINRHVKPMKKMFEAGGIGSFEERLPWLIDNCQRVIDLYPGLVKHRSRGTDYGTPGAKNFHLVFAKRSQTTVNRWRKEHGYL